MHCVGGQRGGRHRSVVGVGFLRLSHPRLLSILFSAPSPPEMNFFSETFSPSVIALEAREWEGIIPSWGRVLEAFSSPPCLYTFSAPTLLEIKFFQKLFPLV